jgi:hypothetical protein
MAKGVMLAVLLAFVVTAAGVAQEQQQAQEKTAPAAGEPTATIENTRHDFGEVYEQKGYKHTFKIKNTGTADLLIEQVKPG